MKILDNGSWVGIEDLPHVFDPVLADAIVQFCKDKNITSVIDLGCGLGDYLRALSKAGVLCIGYDGNPNTYQLTDHLGYDIELHQPIYCRIKSDLVLSLEVGEHIPSEYESVFLDNVCKCANEWIILSWAVPGQQGTGHVNCKSNLYIIFKMHKRGYDIDFEETDKLREQSEMPWFKNSLMVFKKID